MNTVLHYWRFVAAMTGASILNIASAQTGNFEGVNLALVAKSTASYVSGHETISALNNGYDPQNSDDKSHGAYGNWPENGTQWVQYEWTQRVNIGKIDVYWFDDARGVRLPKSCRISYWDGTSFRPVNNPSGLGTIANKYNTTTFAAVDTSKLRLEFESEGKSSTGILQWKTYDTGKSPNFAPVVNAGVDRVVVMPGKTFLRGAVRDDGKPNLSPVIVWSKASGPGRVVFENPNALTTTATFSKPGAYSLQLTADDGQLNAAATLKVTVDLPPPAVHLDPVYTKSYKINSPLWSGRAKKLIVNWIPHCYNTISNTNLAEGGIQNFIEAGKKNAGQPFAHHKGPVFANAWVHNTVESMCVALAVDPQGDSEIAAAQRAIQAKLDSWIPIILSAQEPDGYLQTSYTLDGHARWTNKNDHEGYLGGYFIESAIAHYLMTDRKDPRMYNAAKKLADCWYANIGPAPKKAWHDGHQELEQALARLARLVDKEEGIGKGKKYIELAKFLLDSRGNGDEYDQTHVPVIQQYEAVGHAVRAVYSYSGMADIAMETGDIDYQSAVKSLWNNIVNKKYYITGGVGSGETSEGFGKDYSLPNSAYCESCSGSGELFFQSKMNLIYHDAKYANLYEETLYNAILGDIDLDGRNFTYTNPLDSSHPRYAWHGCPCCVGNIPRTLLMLPTWMYAKSADAIYVNLFIGSTVTVENVAGTDVQMVQTTDYPWSNKVSITVNPGIAKRFSVNVRVPDREVSDLYSSTPNVNGIALLSVNGSPIREKVVRGYAVINRKWKAGDTIELVLPMAVQRVTADKNVAADSGKVALRYGPLVYNIESVDQDIDLALGASSVLSPEWNPNLLGGIVTIKGTFANGAPLLAIPNYARSNRGGRSIVWIKAH